MRKQFSLILLRSAHYKYVIIFSAGRGGGDIQPLIIEILVVYEKYAELRHTIILILALWAYATGATCGVSYRQRVGRRTQLRVVGRRDVGCYTDNKHFIYIDIICKSPSRIFCLFSALYRGALEKFYKIAFPVS